MALIVNTNISALNAQRNLAGNQQLLSKSLERLSSGLRINRAADDAAGLAIATKLAGQVRGLNQAVRNANNAISLVQTAEGGYNTVTNILQRLRELSVQSASDENTASDRANLQLEAGNLISELTRIANTTEFNTMPLTDGSFTGRFFQIGANFGQTISFSIADVRASSIGTRATVTGDLEDKGANAAVGVKGSITSGEVKINGVQALTSTGDDNVSVLEVMGGEIAAQSSFYASTASSVGTMVLTGIIRANDAADIASLVATVVVTTGTTAAASVGLTSSYVLGNTGYTACTFGTVAFSSYATVNVTTATTAAASVGLTASYYIASGYWYGASNYITINGTNITYGTTASLKAYTYSTTASKADYIKAVVDLIDSTSVPYVDARAYASVEANGSLATTKGLLIVATKGVDLKMNGVGSGIATGTGLLGLTSTFVGEATISAVETHNGQSSAIAKAAAVNAIRGMTSVSGTANPDKVAGGSAVAAGTIFAGTLLINGVDIGGVTVLDGDGDGSLVKAINAKKSATGVTASIDNNSKLVLVASDGRNITIFSTANTANITKITDGSDNTDNTFRGTLALNSKDSFTISGTRVTELGENIEAKTYAADLTYKVSLVDISTSDGALNAVLTIDAALDELNSRRSDLGAIQNRLEFTISNLTVSSENFSASESRIRDADFAYETAQFTRNQILVQAGTAMLAQANTLPQIALQLLK